MPEKTKTVSIIFKGAEKPKNFYLVTWEMFDSKDQMFLFQTTCGERIQIPKENVWSVMSTPD